MELKEESSSLNTDRIDHLISRSSPPKSTFKIALWRFNRCNESDQKYEECQPDEIYNLGAMSHVKVSFDTPEYVGNVDGLGTLRILEAVRLLGLEKKDKNLPSFYF